ncbi:DUF2188 domain-containing protein [Enterococcus sp. LJL51]|uniref:DUF2188 domain-containing protein n=1 Tax=Enterococcus sp. LJL51 TaxID=3416656 RepID=UPI003CE81123
MPWDKNDYPASFKNFDPLLRKKVIDIGNALLDEGYPENQAIPIAISQGKKWLDEASDSEKKSFKKENYPRKSDQHGGEKINQDLLNNDVLVYFQEEYWYVKTKGAEKASDSFERKQQALKRAQEIADNKNSKVIQYNKDEQPE